jgi:CubicO group peptidase (beta-lactamase class C family)
MPGRSGMLSVLVLAVGTSSAVAKDPKPKTGALPPLDPKVVEKFDEAVQRVAGKDFWGTVLAARDGKIVFVKGYGFADHKAKPCAPDSLFEIASASKQVTATAILRLEQQKKLKTTDSLGKFFPKAPKDKHGVTLDHLLHHTSGLDPSLAVSYSWTGSRDQYVREILEKPLVEKPGEKFSYSNVGYALLAAVVEEVTKGTFEDYVRKELFDRAGLVDTGFIGDERLVKSDRVTVRRCDDCQPDWTAAKWWYGWGYRGMGGVVTTALDVHAWDRALRGKDILSPAAKEKLHTTALESYACGWRVGRDPNGRKKAEHSGGVRGYVTQISRWLDEDALVVILTSGKPDLAGIERAVAEVLFR